MAANFRSTLEQLASPFEATSEHELVIISGSTGLLYAQIRNGAPFDVLLAADRLRPQLLGEDGLGDARSIFTYAVGRLVLWSPDPARLDGAAFEQIAGLPLRWLAIAEPKIAPYGTAAREALERVGAWESVRGRLVTGQNVAQAFSMVETGGADFGLVALSQALAYSADASYVAVPQRLHAPIRQDAIVLAHGSDNPAAERFVEFLGSAAAAATIERAGYGAPEDAMLSGSR